MKNVWLIFKQDLKNIFTNGFTFITIVALLVIPAFVGGWIIKVNWEPVDIKDKVKIALVNRDIGSIINNNLVNIGDKIIREISEEERLDWEATSYDDALRGLLIGEFYGMLVIPQNFTEDIKVINSDSTDLPKISYIMNIRDNVFIPTFSETNTAKLQVYVAHNITTAVNKAIEHVVGEFNIDLTIHNQEIGDVVQSLLDLNTNRDTYLARLKEYRGTVGNIMVVLTNLDGRLVELKKEVGEIEKLTENMQRVVDITKELEQDFEGNQNSGIDLQTRRTEILLQELKDLIGYIRQDISLVQDRIPVSDVTIGQVYSALSKVDQEVTSMVKNLNILIEKLGFLANSSDINKLIYILENDPELVKEYMASPVLFEQQDIRLFPNYGSAIAPYIVTVCMWLGTMILLTILSTRFQIGKDIDALNSESIVFKIQISPLQEYFGKGLFFIFLSIIQDIIIVAVAKKIIGISIHHYGLFLCISIVGSITITTIIYTFVSVLGNLGKVIIYIFFVGQVLFLDGIFPIHIESITAEIINHWLPFGYIIGGFREAQMGIITSNTIPSMMILICFAIGAVSWGIIGKLFLAPYIESARAKIKESHLGKDDY